MSAVFNRIVSSNLSLTVSQSESDSMALINRELNLLRMSDFDGREAKVVSAGVSGEPPSTETLVSTA